MTEGEAFEKFWADIKDYDAPGMARLMCRNAFLEGIKFKADQECENQLRLIREVLGDERVQ